MGPMISGVSLVAALLALGTAAEAPLAVRGISAVDVPGGEEVRIACTAKPRFTVFKLSDPARVVVDLVGTDVSSITAPIEVHRGGVEAVATAQFAQGEAKVARVTVLLAADAKYEVTESEGGVTVAIGGTASIAATIPAVSPAPAPATTPSIATPAPVAPESVVAADKVVLRRSDHLDVANAARRLVSVRCARRGERTAIELAADGAIADFDLIELEAPARIALDLHGLADSAKHAGPVTGMVKGIRLARHGDLTRVVIDLEGTRAAPYEIHRTKKGLEVLVGRATAVAQAAAVKPAEPVKVAAPVARDSALAKSAVAIHSVDYRADGGVGRVLIALGRDVAYEVTRPDSGTAMLTLRGVALPDALQRNLDVSALDAPVGMVSTYRDPVDATVVKIVATLHGEVPDRVVAAAHSLRWELGASKLAKMSSTVTARAAAEEAKPPVVQSTQGPASASTASVPEKYVGRRVDFNVKDIDIVNLLEALADIAKKNIIVTDDVHGKVTIRLRNVPWDEALEIVLKSKGLGKEEFGNIVRVAPLERLQSEAKAAADSRKADISTKPIHVKLIPVNYASATDLAEKLKDTLTERGSITVDGRTNVLIVKDIDESLARAESVVRNLDTQTPQVLIEARIVEASTSYVRQIGIQWGGNMAATQGTGNPTGLAFPNLIAVGGAADDSAAPTAPFSNPLQNFVVNFPAPIGVNTGAGLGFLFGSAGGAANLALRLSAFENEGTIKTISSPKVTTLDNQAATISQGVSIPFSQVSAAGVSTAFIEARLSLTVTPHVTQDGSIVMKINASNNQPNPGLTGSNGQPSITRREANTDVLVRDNDTTVIGGIYTRRNAENLNEVPGLSKIPILGYLFSKKALSDDRTELLIFISPKIVNRQQSTVAATPDVGGGTP